MRRLSEILAFPRAWYRRSIARRLFLGDQTINLPGKILLLIIKNLFVEGVIVGILYTLITRVSLHM